MKVRDKYVKMRRWKYKMVKILFLSSFFYLEENYLKEKKNKKFFYKLVLSKNFVLDKRKKKNDVKMTEI